jgi:hypothetical protein
VIRWALRRGCAVFRYCAAAKIAMAIKSRPGNEKDESAVVIRTNSHAVAAISLSIPLTYEACDQRDLNHTLVTRLHSKNPINTGLAQFRAAAQNNISIPV